MDKRFFFPLERERSDFRTMEEELRVIVSMPSENNNRRSSVLRFDSDSSHLVLSTPAGGASPCYTSRSLAYVAQGDVQPPLPRLSPPDAAQETAAAAISITSNGRMPGWLGELYLRLGPAVVFHLHAFFVRGQTIIRAHLLHPSPHRRTVS